MHVTLTVKDGPHAETIALDHLNRWFVQGGHDAPFPPGTLLHYALHREPECQSSALDENTRHVLTGERYLSRERMLAQSATYAGNETVSDSAS